jgi:DNA-binding beta-propeller fold protein YncE
MRSLSRATVFFASAVALASLAPALAQEVQNPRRIAGSARGDLLVADRGGMIVAIDKSSLAPLWSFELPTDGAPFGLATSSRLVYVGNTTTMGVEVYRLTRSRRNASLRFQYRLGEQEGEDLIEKPIDIAVDRALGLVFVLDGARKEIKVYDSKGSFLYAFSPMGEAGQLLSPVSLGLDVARRELLVGDYGDPSGSFSLADPARILIYNYDGALLFQINGDGSTDATTQFVRLQGIATSADGRIFAADPLRSVILVIERSTGALIGELGTPGVLPGELMLPLDVLLDESTGDLFVSNNRGARRIEVIPAAEEQP